MGTININNLIEIVQRKVAGVSASTSIRDLENLMELVMLSGGGHLMADSAGFDSDVADTPGRLIFVDSGGEGFFNFNKSIDRAVSSKVARRGPNRPRKFKFLKRRGTYTARSSGSSGAAGYGGTTSGYVIGGYTPAATFSSVIDKTPYVADANATDVGDLTSPLYYFGQGGMDATHGYHMGGYDPAYTYQDRVDAFPFASDGNATASPYVLSTGQGAQAAECLGDRSTVMYSIGVTTPLPAGPHIQKFALPISANSTDVGDAVSPMAGTGVYSHAGHSSSTKMYTSGGVSPSIPGGSNVIQSIPFASDENATDVGDLLGRYREVSGSSSSTHGYTVGGRWLVPEGNPSPTNIQKNEIQKFPFASDANATDAADLTNPNQHGSGHSSTTHGYLSGGTSPSPTHSVNVIQKYPFASDTNATDVGDLTAGRYYAAASQY